jgi:hypothetical protein
LKLAGDKKETEIKKTGVKQERAKRPTTKKEVKTIPVYYKLYTPTPSSATK